MADTSGGYANWVRREATDSQIVAMRDQRDELNRELQKLRHYMSVRVMRMNKGVEPITLLDEYEWAVEDGFFKNTSSLR